MGRRRWGIAGLVYEGLHVLGQGAVLAGIVLGAMVTFILEKQLFRAALTAAIGAALSWIGLLHAEQVEWAASPGVALGYLFLAILLAAIGLSQRASREPGPVESEQPEATGAAVG